MDRVQWACMLEVSCRHAEAVLLGQTYFHLDARAFEEFQRKLGEPPEINEPLRTLLNRKPSWDSSVPSPSSLSTTLRTQNNPEKPIPLKSRAAVADKAAPTGR